MTKILTDVGLQTLVNWVKTTFSDQKLYIDQNDSQAAKSDYGYLSDVNLLTWAQAQTRSGSFGVQKTTTTQGIPNNTPDYFIGYLDVVSTSAKRIVLTSRVNAETYINTWYNSAWTGWHHLTGYEAFEEITQEVEEVLNTCATPEYVEQVFEKVDTSVLLNDVVVEGGTVKRLCDVKGNDVTEIIKELVYETPTPEMIGVEQTIKCVEKTSEYAPFTGSGGLVNGVYSVGGKIIVLGDGDSSSFKYSEDGFHWEDLELPVTCGSYSSLVHANGRFLLNLDQRNDQFLYSDDGKNWNVIPAGPEFNGYYPIYSTGDKFFYIGSNAYSDSSIYVSSDGIEWTKITADTYRVSSIYYIAILDNKIFAPIGANGILICEDINDLSGWVRWMPTISDIGDDIMGTNGTLITTNYNSDGNTEVYYSKDGERWYDSGLLIPGLITDMACGDGKFLLRSMKDIYCSIDGQHWSKTTCPFTINALNRMIYHDGKFFMFGTNSYSTEHYLVSSNGIDWSRTTYEGLETVSGENVTLNLARILRSDPNALTNAEIDEIVSSVFGT